MAMLGKGSASAEFVTCSTVFVYYRHHLPLRPKHALRIAKDPSGNVLEVDLLIFALLTCIYGRLMVCV